MREELERKKRLRVAMLLSPKEGGGGMDLPPGITFDDQGKKLQFEKVDGDKLGKKVPTQKKIL